MELKVFQLTLEECKDPRFHQNEFAVIKLANLDSIQIQALYAFVRGPDSAVTASDGYSFSSWPLSTARPISILSVKDDGREQFCAELKIVSHLSVFKEGEPVRRNVYKDVETPCELGWVAVPNSLVSKLFAAIGWK